MSMYIQNGAELAEIPSGGGVGGDSPRLVKLYKTLTGSEFSDPIALCAVWDTETMYVCRVIGYWDPGEIYIRFTRNDFPLANYDNGANGVVLLRADGDLRQWSYSISSGKQGFYINNSTGATPNSDFYNSKYFCIRKA